MQAGIVLTRFPYSSWSEGGKEYETVRFVGACYTLLVVPPFVTTICYYQRSVHGRPEATNGIARSSTL